MNLLCLDGSENALYKCFVNANGKNIKCNVSWFDFLRICRIFKAHSQSYSRLEEIPLSHGKNQIERFLLGGSQWRFVVIKLIIDLNKIGFQFFLGNNCHFSYSIVSSISFGSYREVKEIIRFQYPTPDETFVNFVICLTIILSQGSCLNPIRHMM